VANPDFSEVSEVRWTETARMRCRIIGSSTYFKRTLASVAQFTLGFAAVFFLLVIFNQEIWRARGPEVVLAAAAFGTIFRLWIAIAPAIISLNDKRLYYNRAGERGFSLASCKAFSLTHVAGLLRLEFDAPRRRANGFDRIIIAAPQSAEHCLTPLVENTPLPTAGIQLIENLASSNLQLEYEQKQANPYGGAFFGMGYTVLLLGIVVFASPIVEYLFFRLPRRRVFFAIAISWPIGVIFIAIGVWGIRAGLPWIRSQRERAQRTKKLK
jgi:hypothetical protein